MAAAPNCHSRSSGPRARARACMRVRVPNHTKFCGLARRVARSQRTSTERTEGVGVTGVCRQGKQWFVHFTFPKPTAKRQFYTVVIQFQLRRVLTGSMFSGMYLCACVQVPVCAALSSCAGCA